MSRPNLGLRDAALGYASRASRSCRCTTPCPTTATSRPSPATNNCRTLQ